MWEQQADYDQFKEKSDGEGWLVNRQEGMLIQIKPDAPTQHAQFVLVSTHRLTQRLGDPVRKQRMLRHLGIEMWISGKGNPILRAADLFSTNIDGKNQMLSMAWMLPD